MNVILIHTLNYAIVLGCVWFEDKSEWDMAIHEFRDMDIHVIFLVGWMGRAIFLFGWMDEIGWDGNT